MKAKNKHREVFIDIICFLFIGMFIYAATSKWFDFSMFKIQMSRQPLNRSLISVLIWAIPFSEVIVSILMMIPKKRHIGLRIATGMMLIFTGYILLGQLHYFGEIPCSCGGVISNFTWNQHLIFNLFFVLIGFIGIYFQLPKGIFNSNIKYDLG
jgi:uncharacterized membrane protein YphA (DoxX/SURF4 family)